MIRRRNTAPSTDPPLIRESRAGTSASSDIGAFAHVNTTDYTHVYRRRSTVAIYNSLTMEVAFLPNALETLPEGVASHVSTADLDRLRHRGLDAGTRWSAATGVLSDLRSKALREGIRTIYFMPMMGCNLQCSYCQFIQDFGGRAGMVRMTATQARQLVDRFYELSAGAPPRRRDFVFFGGEPFLAPDVMRDVMTDIREVRGDNDMNLLAFTNGTVVTDEIAATCARYGLYAIVSIDGPPDVHDRARVDPTSRGSCARTLEGYRRLKEAGCRTAISLMLGSHNVGSLRESVLWLLRELEPDELGIAGVFHPLGNAPNPYQIGPTDAVSALVETYIACRERGVYVDQVARRLRPFVTMRPKLKDCMACGGKVVATPWGIRGSCEYLAFRRQSPRRPLGTIDGDRPEDWDRRSAIWNAGCQNCPALGVCGGGCPYNALQLHGSLDALDEDHCAQTRLLLGWMLGDLFRVCERRGALAGSSVVFPTPADRRALLGNIVEHDGLPLRTVSTHGEETRQDAHA